MASIHELKSPELGARITFSKEEALINLGIYNHYRNSYRKLTDINAWEHPRYILTYVLYRHRYPGQSAGESGIKNNPAKHGGLHLK